MRQKAVLNVTEVTRDEWLIEGNALLHSGAKRYEEALTAYDQALRLDPTSAIASLGRGNALAALKDYEEAQVAYDLAIQLDASQPFAYLGIGLAHHAMERYEEALARL